MKIYHFDPISKLFTREGEADISPLEADVFLLPAHSTIIEPPKFAEDEQVYFVNGQWEKEKKKKEENPSLDRLKAISLSSLGKISDAKLLEPLVISSDGGEMAITTDNLLTLVSSSLLQQDTVLVRSSDDSYFEIDGDTAKDALRKFYKRREDVVIFESKHRARLEELGYPSDYDFTN